MSAAKASFARNAVAQQIFRYFHVGGMPLAKLLFLSKAMFVTSWDGEGDPNELVFFGSLEGRSWNDIGTLLGVLWAV